MLNPHKKRKIENEIIEQNDKESTLEVCSEDRSFQKNGNSSPEFDQVSSNPLRSQEIEKQLSGTNEIAKNMAKIDKLTQFLESKNMLLKNKKLSDFELIEEHTTESWKARRIRKFIILQRMFQGTNIISVPVKRLYRQQLNLEKNLTFFEDLEELLKSNEQHKNIEKIEAIFLENDSNSSGFPRLHFNTSMSLNVIVRYTHLNFQSWCVGAKENIRIPENQDFMSYNEKPILEMRNAMIGILNGLSFLHEKKILAGDALDVENLMIDQDTQEVLLCGVGLEKKHDHHLEAHDKLLINTLSPCAHFTTVIRATKQNIATAKLYDTMPTNADASHNHNNINRPAENSAIIRKRNFSTMLGNLAFSDQDSTTQKNNFEESLFEDTFNFGLLLHDIFLKNTAIHGENTLNFDAISVENIRNRIDFFLHLESHQVVTDKIISELETVLKSLLFPKTKENLLKPQNLLGNFDFFKKEANIFMEDLAAMFAESLKYSDGEKRIRNYTKGGCLIKYLACEKNYAPAKFMHGVYCIYGMGVSGFDKNGGKKLLLHSWKEAFEALEGELMQRFPRYACTVIGYAYNLGIGVKLDYKKAVEYFEKGAQHGHIGCLNALGTMYLEGFGCEKDLQKAIHYFEQAVQKEECGALYNMAILMESGEGVPKNQEKAFEYCKTSAELGFLRSQTKLGVMYDFGIGVPKNDQMAYFWYQTAASRGDSEAQYNLGCMNEFGQYVPKNYQAALKLFSDSAKQGNVHASLKVAAFYLNGVGVKRNESIAYHHFKTVCAKGATTGAHNFFIAIMNLKGVGTIRDFKTAQHFFKLSVQNNDTNAQRLLESMQEDGKLEEMGNWKDFDENEENIDNFTNPSDENSHFFEEF